MFCCKGKPAFWLLVLVCPAAGMLYTLTLLRLAAWQQAQCCMADLLCGLTTPDTFCAALFLAFGTCVAGCLAWTLEPTFVLALQSRRRIFLCQLRRIAGAAGGTALWSLLGTAMIARAMGLPAINWQQYESYYFLVNGQLGFQPLWRVALLCALCLFGQLVLLGLALLFSLWSCKTSWPGLTVWILWYLAQAAGLPLGLGMGSCRLQNWTQPVWLGVALLLCMDIILTAAGWQLAKRRDLV